jgi:hypothetical protein
MSNCSAKIGVKENWGSPGCVIIVLFVPYHAMYSPSRFVEAIER